jgi:hypothetical protein
MIDIEKVKKEEEDEMKQIFSIVKHKSINILNTEMIMQQKSIYSENYKPLFINEMDEEKIEDFTLQPFH